MTLRGHEQVMQVVRAFWDALPDAKITADDQVAAGNVVVAEGTIAGMHSGTFRTPQGEIPRTGNPVSLRYAAVKRFKGDRLDDLALVSTPRNADIRSVRCASVRECPPT